MECLDLGLKKHVELLMKSFRSHLSLISMQVRRGRAVGPLFKLGLKALRTPAVQDYPNNDIFPTAGPTNAGVCGNSATQESIGACITRCDNTLACVGIAHYADNSCCYLKSTQTNKTPNARVASYKKMSSERLQDSVRAPNFAHYF